MDGRRPSSSTAPSIWYDAVAAPQRKPSGNISNRGSTNCCTLVIAAAPPVWSPAVDWAGPRPGLRVLAPGDVARLHNVASSGVAGLHNVASSDVARPHNVASSGVAGLHNVASS